jgi:hypothetical protein
MADVTQLGNGHLGPLACDLHGVGLGAEALSKPKVATILMLGAGKNKPVATTPLKHFNAVGDCDICFHFDFLSLFIGAEAPWV